ncbi:DHA2 family efflux MFS transporter permease subunit [Secundilactobacillus collinoides]|uniref:Major facilitator superfamily (MFS) profile domain-containing protein n=2 Tax=Secundilactobacillus collinoides TaxID=33960 RepID=A0A0R2BMD6_SECCO|nr:DHA2 family efflux MFS transporter permease subunit [Secundilactobacillus collinoides]KRM76684.1 hypothetical protein FC82_GL001165 [Secundilactobacillus collinoides DSM 20515 = JCM 1123]KZL35577.1 hypothetical protein TY91_16430 [Secundilactobacillus collinoides]
MQKTAAVSTKTKLSIIGTAGLAFCGVLVETSLNVTFPTLMKQFHQSLNNVQWVTTAYLLAVAATMTVTAFAQRRFKARNLLLTAGILFVIGVCICGSASSLTALLIGRIIQGFSTGLAMPMLFAIIMQQVPLNLQGRYMGTGGMAIALAPSLGPTYGGIVTQALGWQLIFWIILPLGILSCLLAVVTVEQAHPTQQVGFPLGQFLLVLFGLIGLTLGVNNAGSVGLTSPACYGYLVLGIVCLAVFAWLASRAPHPLIDVHIFKSGLFTRALLIYFAIQFVQIGFTFIIPNFAQLALHQNTTVAGLLLLTGSLLSAVVQPFTGKLLDNTSAKLPFSIGSVFLLLGTGLMFGFATHLTVWMLVVFYAIYMFGFSFIFNTSMTFGLQQLAGPKIADGNATFNTLQQYAGSLGTAIASTILAMTTTNHPHLGTVAQTTMGSREVFGFFLVVCVLVTGIVVSLPKLKNQSSRQ